MQARPMIHWMAQDTPQQTCWHSEAGLPPPARVIPVDDTISADEAWRRACEGEALLWQGDYQNARHLLEAMQRRVERKPRSGSRKARDRQAAPTGTATPAEQFHRHRLSQLQRARTLGMLLIPVTGDYRIPLRRGPEVRLALEEAWGPASGEVVVVSLRELLGLIGAHEWRKKGVAVPALGERVHPWYGVYSPVRGEYVDLVARATLPARDLAFDIGTGTGVLAAVLARRGVARVIATELDPRALACARDNVSRLGLDAQIGLVAADLWPEGRAGLIVCNPPWIPAKPSAPIERAIYDEGSRMLLAFLDGLRDHLLPGGEGWLLLSDLAEHLGLRSRDTLLGWIAAAGLQVLGQDSIKPRHGKAQDPEDPLHAARAAEVTTLWRLGLSC